MNGKEVVDALAAVHKFVVNYGPSPVAFTRIARVQGEDGICAYIDLPGTLDPTAAEEEGVVINDLYIAQPKSLNEAIEIASSLLDSHCIDLLVIAGETEVTALIEPEGSNA
jgi:RecA/RadA recombinase